MRENVNIVIVEDNHNDVELLMDALQESKINVKIQVLKDGAEASKYFFDSAGNYIVQNVYLPRLILLDLKLPKINGFEILKMLKTNRQTKNIPVVIFTSSNEEKDRAEGFALGANSYIVKPSNADEFSRYGKDIVNYWAKMNSPAS
jgi:two-component system, response regulator